LQPIRFLRLSPVIAALLAAGCSSWHLIRQDEEAAAPVSRQLVDRINGHWRRPGDASCAAGPEVSRDHDRLVVVTDGQHTVHHIEGGGPRKASTRVVEPAGGPRYRLRSADGGGDGARNFTLTVQNRSTGATVTWTPCSVG
jgi:hypothetical protein